MKLFVQFILILFCVIYFVEAEDEKTAVARKKKYAYHKFKHLIRFAIWYGFGFHALAILYWLKVKAVIIAFIVGSAIVWGARYFWAHKTCPKEEIHEGPIIPFSHGPLWSSSDHIPYSPSYTFEAPHDHHSYSFDSHHDHHDHHTPYSFDPHHDHHHSFESFPSSSFLDSPPPEVMGSSDHSPTSDKTWKRKSRQKRQFDSEDQISNIIFAFLGVNSDACRRRFVCEWEFRSKRAPITSLVFRVFGRGIFTKYLRDSTKIRSFDECGVVHNECRFIEEDIPEKEYEDSHDEESTIHYSHENLTPSESENINENETDSTSTEMNVIDGNRDVDANQTEKIIIDRNLNKVRNNQPEVKLLSSTSNESIKKKNIIAETLFNRSRSKIRVVPIRS